MFVVDAGGPAVAAAGDACNHVGMAGCVEENTAAATCVADDGGPAVPAAGAGSRDDRFAGDRLRRLLLGCGELIGGRPARATLRLGDIVKAERAALAAAAAAAAGCGDGGGFAFEVPVDDEDPGAPKPEAAAAPFDDARRLARVIRRVAGGGGGGGFAFDVPADKKETGATVVLDTGGAFVAVATAPELAGACS